MKLRTSIAKAAAVITAAVMLIGSGMPVYAMSQKTQQEVEANNRAIVNSLIMTHSKNPYKGNSAFGPMKLHYYDELSFPIPTFIELYNSALNKSGPSAASGQTMISDSGIPYTESSNYAYSYDGAGNIIASSGIEERDEEEGQYRTVSNTTYGYDIYNHIFEYDTEFKQINTYNFDGEEFSDNSSKICRVDVASNYLSGVLTDFTVISTDISDSEYREKSYDDDINVKLTYDKYGRINAYTLTYLNQYIYYGGPEEHAENLSYEVRLSYKNNRISKVSTEDNTYTSNIDSHKRYTSFSDGFVFAYNSDGTLAGYTNGDSTADPTTIGEQKYTKEYFSAWAYSYQH